MNSQKQWNGSYKGFEVREVLLKHTNFQLLDE